MLAKEFRIYFRFPYIWENMFKLIFSYNLKDLRWNITDNHISIFVIQTTENYLIVNVEDNSNPNLIFGVSDMFNLCILLVILGLSWLLNLFLLLLGLSWRLFHLFLLFLGLSWLLYLFNLKQDLTSVNCSILIIRFVLKEIARIAWFNDLLTIKFDLEFSLKELFHNRTFLNLFLFLWVRRVNPIVEVLPLQVSLNDPLLNQVIPWMPKCHHYSHREACALFV